MSPFPPKPYKEERPWGDFVEFTKNAVSTVKIITVKEHEALSLQSHNERDEFWRILSGTGFVTIEEEHIEALPGMDFFVPRGTKHRIEGGDRTLVVLEISFGTFDENDIKRFDDKYGRLNPSHEDE